MPQFDPSTFPAQIFWLVVSFIALYWLVMPVIVTIIQHIGIMQDRRNLQLYREATRRR